MKTMFGRGASAATTRLPIAERMAEAIRSAESVVRSVIKDDKNAVSGSFGADFCSIGCASQIGPLLIRLFLRHANQWNSLVTGAHPEPAAAGDQSAQLAA